MQRLTQYILSVLFILIGLAISQELRGSVVRDGDEDHHQAAKIMSVRLQQQHQSETFPLDTTITIHASEHARALTRKKAGSKPKKYSSGGGFDLNKYSRPRNDRDPDKLKKQYGYAKKTTRKTKPYNSYAQSAAQKAIQTKSEAAASNREKAKKFGGGGGKRIKGKLKKLGKKIKDAEGKLKKKFMRMGKKKKASTVGKSPVGTSTQQQESEEEEERVEPQNPLKTTGGVSTNVSQGPVVKPQTPLVKPQPESEKPTVIHTEPKLPPKVPETIPALTENGVPVQPKLEPEEEPAEPVVVEEPQEPVAVEEEEEEPETVSVNNGGGVSVSLSTPKEEPAPDEPAETQTQQTLSQASAAPVYAAPAYSPAYSPAYAPASPVAAE